MPTRGANAVSCHRRYTVLDLSVLEGMLSKAVTWSDMSLTRNKPEPNRR